MRLTPLDHFKTLTKVLQFCYRYKHAFVEQIEHSHDDVYLKFNYKFCNNVVSCPQCTYNLSISSGTETAAWIHEADAMLLRYARNKIYFVTKSISFSLVFPKQLPLCYARNKKGTFRILVLLLRYAINKSTSNIIYCLFSCSMLGTKSISYIFRYAENKIHWTHRLGIGKSNGFVSNITFVLAFSFCAGFSSRLSFKVCILLSLLLIYFSVYHIKVANGKCLLTCKIKHFQFFNRLAGASR